MQEFLINDTVNCNLMSLTGYRTLVILSLLMEAPQSVDSINEFFLNHKYIKETFSNDMLRIYINSLRAAGCEIERASKANGQRYVLISHPFKFDISNAQLKSLFKLYKSICDQIDFKDLVYIEDFFVNLLDHISNQETINLLLGKSLFKSIDRFLLRDLIHHCEKKNQITFLYDSPKSGPKEIEIIADKLSIKSNKAYFWGNDLTHGQYSYFLVEKIIKICSIKISPEKKVFPNLIVGYELYSNIDRYIPEQDETVLERRANSLLIEVNSKNEFSVMQRLLSKADDCRIIYPEEFKKKFINKLKLMVDAYER